MKLRIRGNSLRIRVSKPELERIADAGSAEDAIGFAPGSELRYRVEIKDGDGVEAAFDGSRVRIAVPRAEIRRWLEPGEVAIEGRQAIGGGTYLKILVEKDYTCLTPRSGEDDSGPAQQYK